MKYEGNMKAMCVNKKREKGLKTCTFHVTWYASKTQEVRKKHLTAHYLPGQLFQFFNIRGVYRILPDTYVGKVCKKFNHRFL